MSSTLTFKNKILAFIAIVVIGSIAASTLASTELVPTFSTLILPIGFQKYSLLQYGLIYFPIGIGGLTAAFCIKRFFEEKGLFKTLTISILLFLLAYYFLGLILITSLSAFNYLIFLGANFVVGFAHAVAFSVIMLWIYLYFPKRMEVLLPILSGIIIFIASWLSSYSFKPHIVLFTALSFSIILILTFLLIDLFLPLPKVQKLERKTRWFENADLVLTMFFIGYAEHLIVRIAFQSTLYVQISAYFLLIGRFLLGLLLYFVPLRKVFFTIPLLMIFCLLPSFFTDGQREPLSYYAFGLLSATLLPLFSCFFLRYTTFPHTVLGKLFGSFLVGYSLSNWSMKLWDLYNPKHLWDTEIALLFSVLLFLFFSLNLYKNRPEKKRS